MSVNEILKLPYDPKGFPNRDEELRILSNACLDAFGVCGEAVPVELLTALHRMRVGLVGRVHLTKMSNAAARGHEAERLAVSASARISELERKRAASGKHIADLHRKLAKLKVSKPSTSGLEGEGPA